MATDDLIMFCNTMTQYLPRLNTLYYTILDTEITQNTLLLVTSVYDAFGTKEPLTRTDLLTEQTWQLNASRTSTLENQNGYILCTDSYYAIQLDVHSLIAST